MDNMLKVKFGVYDFLEMIREDQEFIDDIDININMDHNDEINLYINYRGLEELQCMHVAINYVGSHVYITQNSGAKTNDKEARESFKVNNSTLTDKLKDVLLCQHNNIINTNGNTSYGCLTRLEIA